MKTDHRPIYYHADLSSVSIIERRGEKKSHLDFDTFKEAKRMMSGWYKDNLQRAKSDLLLLRNLNKAAPDTRWKYRRPRK